jgi:hypothetical protein
MEMNRRRVFKLLAMGRITAAEAERLMAAWQASRENGWILLGCAGVAVMAFVNTGAAPMVQHLVHALRVTGWMHGV